MRKRQVPAWMAAYYANSVGGCVLDSYRRGDVVHVDADKPRTGADLQTAEAELAAATEEVNRQYWLFTRTARGTPPTAAACRRREDARQRVLDLRRI